MHHFPTISGAPFLLRVARSMSRAHLRGAGVLTRLLLRLGMLNVVAQYELNHIKFAVPLYRLAWDFKDVKNYEASYVGAFSKALAPCGKVTLFDCGADIGTFSALLCSGTDRIGRVIAFEPNAAAREFLKQNLANLDIDVEMIASAVGSFEGRGQLESPKSDPSDHARFFVPGNGPIHVTTIDSVGVVGGDIAMKLDLEGGEVDALKGAKRTIAAARHCVVGFEASPAVKERTGRDPVHCLEFLESIRAFKFVVAETGESLNSSSPLLKEGQTHIWNVVGWSSV
jgi:FkbM family methyltransferase